MQMTYERFQELHSRLNKIENEYSYPIAYLSNQKNMHASILNEFSPAQIDAEKEKFSDHACAYLILEDSLKGYEEFPEILASFNSVICKHDLSEFIEFLNK